MSSRSAATRDEAGKLLGDVLATPAWSAPWQAAPDANAALDYSIITTRAGFDSLAIDWDALFARGGRGAQYFQTFSWCWHWCNHYLPEPAASRSLAIVTGRRAGRLALVWPLVITRTAGVVRLSPMGSPVSQYSDALIEPSAAAPTHLRAAWDSVLEAVKPDLVWLPRVREDATIAPLMQELGGLVTQRLEAPYIDLKRAGDFDTFMRRHSSHTRKKYRAAGRRLASLGTVETIDLTGGASASELAADAIRMKRRQLLERGILSPAFADKHLSGFFADVALGRQHPTGTRVYALQCNGESVAANIVLASKDRLLGHVFAFDSRFAKDSVGAQLLNHTYKRAIEDGYRTFDLLAPADEYKMRSADGTVGVNDWAIPVSAKGAAFARIYLMQARPLLKKALLLLPARLRHVLAQRYYRGL